MYIGTTVFAGLLMLFMGHVSCQGLMEKCLSYNLQPQLEKLSKCFQTTHNMISNVNFQLSLDDCTTVSGDAVFASTLSLSPCKRLPSKDLHKVRLEMVLKKKAILNVFKDKISEIIKKKLTNTNQNTDNVTGALKQMFARITNETSTLEQIYKEYSSVCFFSKSFNTLALRQSLNVAINKWSNLSTSGILRRILFNLMFVYEHFVTEIYQHYNAAQKKWMHKKYTVVH